MGFRQETHAAGAEKGVDEGQARPDFWRLNPATDHLIQMFPEPFWFDITILIGAFTLFQVLLIGSVSGLYLYLTRPDEEGAQPVRPLPVRRPMEPRPRIPPPRPGHLTH